MKEVDVSERIVVSENQKISGICRAARSVTCGNLFQVEDVQ